MATGSLQHQLPPDDCEGGKCKLAVRKIECNHREAYTAKQGKEVARLGDDEGQQESALRKLIA